MSTPFPKIRDSAELLSPRAAAKYLGLSPSTLARMRRSSSDKKGPRFCRLGGSIRYQIGDLDAWIRQSTVDPTRPLGLRIRGEGSEG